MKNEEDNLIVNIPPLHETLEEKRPYLRTKKTKTDKWSNKFIGASY